MAITVVQIATFEANASFGKFKVIWDRVPSPNIRYPTAAKEPYIAVHNMKLFPVAQRKVLFRNTLRML